MSEATRFIVAGNQRTGTTLLRTSLSSHPDVVCYGEVFKLSKPPYKLPGGYWAYSRSSTTNRIRAALLPRASFREYLNRLYSRQQYRAVGFKLMMSHCKSKPVLWPLIRQHEVKAVLVTRRNVLKTLVSRLVAAASGVYHVSASLPVKTAVANWAGQMIVVNPATIIQDLDTIARQPVEWRSFLERMEFMELVYEDYVRDQLSWNAKVLDFLGVPRQPLMSDLKKVNPDELRNLVSNYDVIAELVRSSPYSYCLNSDD